MPILVEKLTVTAEVAASKENLPSTKRMTAEEQQALIEACVEEVLKTLEKVSER
jgi:hypothetical protein